MPNKMVQCPIDGCKNMMRSISKMCHMHSRMAKRKQIPSEELIDCACGCGQKLKRYIKYSKGKPAERKYIHGHNARITKQKRNCDNCGKEIVVPAYKIAEHSFHFCSTECSGLHRRKQIDVTCNHCGSNFMIPFNRYDKTKSKIFFCSKQCQLEKRIKTNCNYCGKEILRSPSTMKERNYCSRKCQHDWLSQNLRGENHPLWEGGGRPDRGSNWMKQRKAAIIRDSRKCRMCGSDKKLCVHHIKKFREFDNPNDANTLTNLITLCRHCHGKVEPRKRNHELNKRLKKLISSNPYQIPLII